MHFAGNPYAQEPPSAYSGIGIPDQSGLDAIPNHLRPFAMDARAQNAKRIEMRVMGLASGAASLIDQSTTTGTTTQRFGVQAAGVADGILELGSDLGSQKEVPSSCTSWGSPW